MTKTFPQSLSPPLQDQGFTVTSAFENYFTVVDLGRGSRDQKRRLLQQSALVLFCMDSSGEDASAWADQHLY